MLARAFRRSSRVCVVHFAALRTASGEFQSPNRSRAISSGFRYSTFSLQRSSRSRAVTVVFPAPFGPAMMRRTGLNAVPWCSAGGRSGAPLLPSEQRQSLRVLSGSIFPVPHGHARRRASKARGDLRRWARTRGQKDACDRPPSLHCGPAPALARSLARRPRSAGRSNLANNASMLMQYRGVRFRGLPACRFGPANAPTDRDLAAFVEAACVPLAGWR